jgi:tripartite-type tricarboxylate transporter receptor subunit TctC
MRVLLSALSAALLVCSFASAQADDVAAFYKGKQLRFLVGSSAGGAYDLSARAVARHIVQYIPGHPTAIVQNQPAASGYVMVNQLYALGPRDGTVIGIPNNGAPVAPLLMTGTQFDPTKLIWLGSTNHETYVAFIWHTVPIKSIAELADKELVVGSVGAGASMTQFPLLLRELLGYRFKIVRGYSGTPAINLAIERGEVQGNAGVGWASVKALSKDWLDAGKIRVIAQFGYQRNPELADVPAVMELAKNDADRLAMRLVFARTEYARPFFVPPGVPPERVAALRRAFDETMRDPAFLDEAAKMQLEVSPIPGAKVQGMIEEVAHTPADIVRRVRAALDVPDAK